MNFFAEYIVKNERYGEIERRCEVAGCSDVVTAEKLTREMASDYGEVVKLVRRGFTKLDSDKEGVFYDITIN